MPGHNVIANLYPLTKFYMAVVLMVVSFMLPGIASKLICFLFINALAAASGVWSVFIRRELETVGVLFLILFVIQTLFYPDARRILFTFWIFSVKYEGIMFALNLGLMLLCAGGSLIWFFAVTKQKDFVLSLEKAGMSPKASYVVLSTLQIVPVLRRKSKTIMNAQRARGVETEGGVLTRAKVFLPTMIPLVLSSIAGTEERALTLEARGFSSRRTPTHLEDIKATAADKVAVTLITVAFVALIAGRIALWLI